MLFRSTQLVRAGEVIGPGLLDRIASVAQIDEVYAFDHAAIANIEAGNDADPDGHLNAIIVTKIGAPTKMQATRPNKIVTTQKSYWYGARL